MDKQKGPLLYINSVTVINEKKESKSFNDNETLINEPPKQEEIPPKDEPIDNHENEEKDVVEDDHEEETSEEDLEEEVQFNIFECRKLYNILAMYRKNRPVLCEIVTKNETIIGVPFQENSDVLSVKISEFENKDIPLSDIREINIIKF